jgi:hypothetical protein
MVLGLLEVWMRAFGGLNRYTYASLHAYVLYVVGYSGNILIIHMCAQLHHFRGHSPSLDLRKASRLVEEGERRY